MLLLMVLVTAASCEKKENESAAEHKSYTIPSSLKTEHEELHEELSNATKLPGNTGAAARKVADALHPHFVAEEEYAMPQLALLQELADGKYDESMNEAVQLSNKLKAELPQMLKEHGQIVTVLDELVSAARQEGHTEVVAFAEKLKAHALMEEQVLYPASILVGEYIKLKSQAK